MKGLIRYLSPFAPDQSGACAVFYDLGGITVICDAGGCTGNVCGFDEPRWFAHQSGIFSAGLRDMDAVLGRDDLLVKKLQAAVAHLRAPFAVLIGTPVPAVIATDFHALCHLAQKQCQVPVLYVGTTGTRLYDEGEEEAYLALFHAFAADDAGASASGAEADRIGVIGATPLNTGTAMPAQYMAQAFPGKELLLYGAQGGLEAVKMAGSVSCNLVIAPSGLKAAKYLQQRFGTPYRVEYPVLDAKLEESLAGLSGKRVLVVHQQVLANEVRKRLMAKGENQVQVTTFFQLKNELKQEGDICLKTEEQFRTLALEGGFDVIVGDPFLRRACREFAGQWIDAPHFAVSGDCRDV